MAFLRTHTHSGYRGGGRGVARGGIARGGIGGRGYAGRGGRGGRGRALINDNKVSIVSGRQRSIDEE